MKMLLIKNTNEIAILEKKSTHVGDKGGTILYARSGGELKCLFPREVSPLDHLLILDEYKKVDSDFVFTAEDSDGVLYEVLIPIDDISSYFESEYIDIIEGEDFQSAGQFIFDEWLFDDKIHDIEIKIKL